MGAPTHPTIDTTLGTLPQLGTVQVHGTELLLASAAYGNGVTALVAAFDDGEVYAKLTTNLDPWPASPWSVLTNHDPDGTDPDVLLTMTDLVALPTGRTFPSGFVKFPEWLVLPPMWKRDLVGDLHAVGGGYRVDVENLGTTWGVFVAGTLRTDLVRPTCWQAVLEALGWLQEQHRLGRRVPLGMLTVPRQLGAPSPQLGAAGE